MNHVSNDAACIYFVGGFWRPWKLSSKRCRKVFAWVTRELGPGPKPYVRFFRSWHTGDLYVLVYRRTEVLA